MKRGCVPRQTVLVHLSRHPFSTGTCFKKLLSGAGSGVVGKCFGVNQLEAFELLAAFCFTGAMFMESTL